ncbi:hypothetical protein D9M68_754380 [compost metagenome]
MCTLFSMVRIFRPAASVGLTMSRLLFVMWRKPFSVQASAMMPLLGNLVRMSWPMGPSMTLRAWS